MSCIKLNEQNIPYRLDNKSGPKYLLRGPNCDVGMVVLLPGETFNNHYHKAVEEDFLTLEGEAEIYINRNEKYTLKPGDIIQVLPPNSHYLVNIGTVPWKAVFVKTPYDPIDKVDVNWSPSQ
jgi:quercetin dioxygenase-like cupin family protein